MSAMSLARMRVLGCFEGASTASRECPRTGVVGTRYRCEAPIRKTTTRSGRSLDQTFFYFVHSYYVKPLDRDCILGETDYASRFASICGRGNVFGVQFHPEKSQAAGLRLFRNFAAM